MMLMTSVEWREFENPWILQEHFEKEGKLQEDAMKISFIIWIL